MPSSCFVVLFTISISSYINRDPHIYTLLILVPRRIYRNFFDFEIEFES